MRSVKSMIITELSILLSCQSSDIPSFLFQAVEAKREETESEKGLTDAASRQKHYRNSFRAWHAPGASKTGAKTPRLVISAEFRAHSTLRELSS